MMCVCVCVQTLQFLKTVTEKAQSPSLLTTMTPPLLGHMTSCLLACDVCPAGKEPPGIRTLGELQCLQITYNLSHHHSNGHPHTTHFCM